MHRVPLMGPPPMTEPVNQSRPRKTDAAMNFKTTYWLFAILLVLMVALGIRSGCQSTKKGDATAVFPSTVEDKVTAADIDRVEIERAQTNPDDKLKMVFVRQGTGWRMVEPVAARADAGQIESIIQDVIGLHRDEKADKPGDLAAVGLAKPSLYVTLKKGDREWRLSVGNVSIGQDAKVFVLSG